MKFERRKLADLRPAEYNPRKKLTPDDPEYIQIRNSLNEFGYADPIVINSDGTIIKGHQRRNVMMDLGYTEAEVIHSRYSGQGKGKSPEHCPEQNHRQVGQRHPERPAGGA